MSAQTHRLRTLCLFLLPAVVLAAGCQSRRAGICNEQPWESPTFRTSRALLVAPADELRVLEVDGRDVWGPQIAETHGLRGYLIPAGEHVITASFRYAAPVSGGLTGEIRGDGFKIKHDFQAGREYVALYRIHAHPRKRARWWLEHLVNDVFAPQRYYWTMEIVALDGIEAELAAACLHRPVAVGPDLRDRLNDCHSDLAGKLASLLAAREDLAPEVRQALLYRSIPSEMDVTMARAERLYYSGTQ